MKKDKLEQFFSDKLENFEAPYSQDAWTSVASKLGNNASKTGMSTGVKFALFSAAAIVVAVVTYVAIPEKGVESSLPITQTEQISEKPITQSNQSKTADNQTITKQESNELNETTQPQHTENNSTLSSHDERSTDSPASELTTSDSAGENSTPQSSTPSVDKGNSVESKPNYVVGLVSSTLICSGETVTISNLGKDNDIVKYMVNGEVKELSKGKKTSLSFTETTDIVFVNHKKDILSKEIVQVLERPEPNFDFDANVYEKGLPTAKFISYGNYKNITWDFGNDQFAEGHEAITHYFDKGVYNVKMTVVDINGCTGSETKPVEIANKYNLLATNSIRLNDPNLETRTFMPYCLKERDVKFSLMIIDPKDNTVIFESKDVSTPWDGTDQRTGRLLDAHKTFIWQVQLEETIPGERGIYNGTVTIIE